MSPREWELKYQALREEERSMAHLDRVDREPADWQCVVSPSGRVAATRLTWNEAVAWCKSYNETTRRFEGIGLFARMEKAAQCCPHCKRSLRRKSA